jgi:hypothetical protein
MTSIASTDTSNLMIARRLMEIAEKEDSRRKGKIVDEKSALDYLEEDQAVISASAIDAQQQPPQVENINVNLADLKLAVNAEKQNPVRGAAAEAAFEFVENKSVEVRLELRYQSNAPIDGLIVHDQNYAESDRYLFKFADGSTFTIFDKWINKSTTVWGDPHVDLNDVEGNNDGDFKDLKTSDDFTTFMLSDGTRVTFNAKDAGIIEQVDIFKGTQHVKGIGQAAKGYTAESGLFSKQALNDGSAAAGATPMGDVVHVGGDGNDWFDSSNKLVWGKTTAAAVTHRPSATLEFYYRQTVSQSISIQQVVREA